MKNALLKIFIFPFFILSFSFLNGQIVNIENQRLKGDKNGWTGNFDLNFSIIQNTKSIFQFGNRNRLNYKKDQHSYLILTDVLLVKSKNESFANSGFEHFRYAYKSKKYKPIYLEAFEQAQYNRVQQINLRILLGTGARWIVLDRDSAAVNIGTFIMGEHEQSDAEGLTYNIRFSTFLSFDFQLSKNFGFNLITYYQPSAIDPFDFRLSIDASLRMKITEKLQFKTKYNLIYDSNPIPGIPTSNYTFTNSFSYQL